MEQSGIGLPQALHIATLLRALAPQASYTLSFEKGPAVTTLGHLTIYRYQAKASQSEVRAVWAFGCKAALDYSASRRSAILMPQKEIDGCRHQGEIKCSD